MDLGFCEFILGVSQLLLSGPRRLFKHLPVLPDFIIVLPLHQRRLVSHVRYFQSLRSRHGLGLRQLRRHVGDLLVEVVLLFHDSAATGGQLLDVAPGLLALQLS